MEFNIKTRLAHAWRTIIKIYYELHIEKIPYLLYNR